MKIVISESVYERLTEKKRSGKLCARGISSAKKKYDVYPSAYANGHAVQVCKGTIKGLDGKKRRSYSESYFKNVYKKMINEGIVKKTYDYSTITEAEYRGKKVKLNKPFRQSSGGKKFAVYVKSKKGNVKKVRFGAQGYRVRNNSKGRASNFQKRHNCKSKKDRTKAGYWSCNVSRYAKSLGLSSKRKW